MARKKWGTSRFVAVLAFVTLIGLAGGYFLYTCVWLGRKDTATRQITAASGTTKKPSSKDSSQTTTVTSSSTEYENDRYGFRIEQPVEWTRQLSQNGDGAILTSPDRKAVIRTYGFQNISMKSLSEVYSNMEADRRSMFPDLAAVEKKEGLIDGHPDIEAVWQYTEQAFESPFTGQVKTKIMITLKDEAGLSMDYTALTGDYDTYIDVFLAMMAEYKLQ